MQEHRDTIEADAINLDAGVAQIVDAGAEPADCRLIEAFVMIAADEYLVAMGRSHSQSRKSMASRSLPTMQKSPECTTTSASGKSPNRLCHP